MVDVSVIREECFVDEILAELPSKVAKPTPNVKGNNLTKIFNQFSDSLKDIQLQYRCIDVSSVALAFGTNVGNAYIYQRNERKIMKISSETKYVPTTCIKLASGCTTVAFGHESGTFSVGLVDPPIHKSFDSLTAQDIHRSSITCLEWSTDGVILYTGDSSGKISMSVVKISEGILQTGIIVTEDSSVVQLCYTEDSLLISTIKRTVIWSFQTETLVQVGEKERKTSGGYGGCFIPDTLRSPTKKLYAARPGLRIWTADGSGKVSSTSVFKPLLAEKPTTIQTLTGNDKKFNSSGQFGQLLVFYNQYIVTWDAHHVWVLDVDLGNVIGCHSNLGKICDIAVCGHEVFILLNQRERFLRRFILTTERVLDSSCLDAVIAGSDETRATTIQTKRSEAREKSSFDVKSSLVHAPFMSLKSDETRETAESTPTSSLVDSSTGEDNAVVPVSDIFDKINAIPLDEGDIVFSAAKKKKKKKKTKQTASMVAEETLPETELAIESQPHSLSSPHVQESKTISAASRDNHHDMNLETKPADAIISHESLTSDVHDTQSITLAAILNRNSSRSEIQADKSNGTKNSSFEDNQGSETIMRSDDANRESLHEAESSSTEHNIATEDNSREQKTGLMGKDSTILEGKIEIGVSATLDVNTPQKMSEQENLTSQNTQITLNTMEENCTQTTSDKETKMQSTLKETYITATSRQDSVEFTDVYQTSSELHGLDSHENKVTISPKIDQEKSFHPPSKDDHVPVHADTWSGRSLPTTQTIEHLTISQKYIFCVDARNNVYFSDPNTASCSGWEKADFKARQIFVSPACDFILYLEKGKAYVRGNISDINPVGSVSFQILDDVTQLATCSTYTWAITAGNTLKRANTTALVGLRGDLKSSSNWKVEDSIENLRQIVCYDHVLWARSQDETLLVYPGRSSGKKTTWKKEEKKAKWLHISDDGTVWIITPDDKIWFKTHVTSTRPTGEEWYHVTLGQYIIDDTSILESTVNFFYYVGSAYRSARTTEYLRHAAKGFLQSTKDVAFSLFRDGGTPKQICCNMLSGVWLLDTRNALHACRSQTTGAYWDMVCPTGTAKSVTWRNVTTGLAGYIWAIQPNGDFTCFHPKGPSYNVEGPSSRVVDFINGSPHGLWCFVTEHNSKVYLRDGISEDYPQGFAWTSLSLRDLEIGHVKHLSVGGLTVWAVDNNGQIWLRVGDVGGDENSVLAQAWIRLDNPKNIEFANVEVNCNDSMVWAIDSKGGVYAREGVRKNFVVGQEWREVKGVTLKSVCLSAYLVYGLCTSGEMVCRFGVSEMNCIGDYWKKIPGCFSQISVNSAGQLWAISDEEKLYVRKMKCLMFFRGEGKGEGKDEGEIVVDSGGHDEKSGDDEGEWELL